MTARAQSDAVALAVDQPKSAMPADREVRGEPFAADRKPVPYIPPYMKYARDAYLPLDQRPPPVTLWPYVIATIIAVGCVFVVVAYIWRA